MCGCDEAFGNRFLAHQLATGRELETQSHVPVDLGFVQEICPECRGLPPTPAPLAAGFGRTSKIKRYYWREIYFREKLRHAEWTESNPDTTPEQRAMAFCAIEADVLKEIKTEHAESPKYVFSEPSQADIFKLYDVNLHAVYADYSDDPSKGALIRLGEETVSPEAFVSHMYQRQGWSVMSLESMPLHALFGVMMWLLIQDGSDPRVRMVGFGDRDVYEASGEKVPIWTLLPEDFGSKGYAERRKDQIAEHFDLFAEDKEELLWLFDYWVPMSSDLRQYLWAHRESDLARARQLVEVLSPAQICSTLRYLVTDYWGHYLGWPDLLLYRGEEILLVEVKSSNDRLSGDQKRWIGDNHKYLGLPFCVVKLHRAAKQ